MSEIISKPFYDVIIVGAGIAGMTSAALLSRAGLSVCVLEKEPHAGGYLAGFRRKEFRFDSAIHWLNQCGEHGLVHKVFELIGKDWPKPAQLTKIHRTISEHHNYLLTSNPNVLKEELISDFPHEKDGIEKLFKAAERISDNFKLYSNIFRSSDTMGLMDKIQNAGRKMKFIRPLFKYIWYQGEAGMEKGLSLFFKDEKLKKIWSTEPDLLSVLLPIAWAYSGDYQLPPTGGSQVFIEWLEFITNYYKNDVLFNVTVEKILVEDNKTKGVVLSKSGIKHQIHSNFVIAACDVERLYEKMLPPESIDAKLKKNLKGAVLYSSAVAISIALDCPTETLGFGEELVMIEASDIPRAAHDSGDPHQTAISIIPPSLRDKSLAPQGKGTLTIYASAWMDYKNNWGTEQDAQGNYIRTDKYYAIKQEFADIIIDRIEKRMGIDIRKHILFMDVASPITHWRYSYNRDGSIMGARPGKLNMQAKIAHHKTAVEGLILGGHWSDLGGGVPIAVKAAANASLIVLKALNKETFSVLARYADGKSSLDEVEATEVLKSYPNHWTRKPTPAESLKK